MLITLAIVLLLPQMMLQFDQLLVANVSKNILASRSAAGRPPASPVNTGDVFLRKSNAGIDCHEYKDRCI
jgi:hypothetical protein